MPTIDRNRRFKIEVFDRRLPAIATCLFQHRTICNFIGKGRTLDFKFHGLVAQVMEGRLTWGTFLFGVKEVRRCQIEIEGRTNGITRTIGTNPTIVKMIRLEGQSRIGQEESVR